MAFTERWKPILRLELRLRKSVKLAHWPTDPFYWVTSDGRVFHIRRSKKIKGTKRKGGSRTHYWSIHPRSHTPVLIHRMVLEAFVGPCPEGTQTRHLNGLGYDNRLENLVWGTPKENAEDLKRHRASWPHRYKNRHHRKPQPGTKPKLRKKGKSPEYVSGRDRMKPFVWVTAKSGHRYRKIVSSEQGADGFMVTRKPKKKGKT